MEYVVSTDPVADYFKGKIICTIIDSYYIGCHNVTKLSSPGRGYYIEITVLHRKDGTSDTMIYGNRISKIVDKLYIRKE